MRSRALAWLFQWLRAMPQLENLGEPSQPLRRLVTESLERELRLRRDRGPYAQLGVTIGADSVTIRKAYRRLIAQFDPDAYRVHGENAAAVAREISALLEAAALQLGSPLEDDEPSLPRLEPPPRRDETLRALETLRAGIARRKSEALRLKAEGRIAEARRMFEAVRALDPHDEFARAQLRLLRPRRKSLWAALLAWLRGGRRRFRR
jgi:hypothetical protein